MIGRPLQFSMLAWLLLALPNSSLAADLGSEAYYAPLVGNYGIYRADTALSADPERGRFQLVDVHPSSRSSGHSHTLIIPKVNLVAVNNRVIFGRSGKTFFLLDANQTDPRPQAFESLGDWLTALANLGVAAADSIQNPDVIAGTMSDAVLRPWKYRVMQNALGFSDDAWSLIIQIAGLAIAFVIGLILPGNRPTTWIAVVCGLLTNVIAQILIAGGGPGAFVGFFFLPVFCVIAVSAGKACKYGAVFLLRGGSSHI